MGKVLDFMEARERMRPAAKPFRGANVTGATFDYDVRRKVVIHRYHVNDTIVFEGALDPDFATGVADLLIRNANIVRAVGA